MNCKQVFQRALLLAVVSLLATPVCAQKYEEYRELPLGAFAKATNVRKARSKKNEVLKGIRPFNEGKQDLETYYKRFLFPALTSKAHRDKLAKLRMEVVTDLARATSSEARNSALKIVAKYAQGIAKSDKFHPAARYNALLLLGQLNKREASTGKPAVPAGQLLSTVLLPLKPDDKGPVVLKFAAVLSLLRHAELSGHPKSPEPMPNTARSSIVKLLLPLIQNNEPPEGVSADAHAWLQTRAVETLGHLRWKGEPNVAVALSELTINNEQPMSVRCAAAEALGRMASVIDPAIGEQTADRMGQLIVDCSNAQARAMFELLYPNGPRGRRMEGGAGYGPPRRREGGLPDIGEDNRRRRLTVEDVADPITLEPRRRHIFELLTIQRGLTGDKRKGIDGLRTVKTATAKVSLIEPKLQKMIDDLEDIETSVRELGQKTSASREAIVAMLPADMEIASQDDAEIIEAAAEAIEAADEAMEAADAIEEAAEAATEPAEPAPTEQADANP